MYGSNSLIQKYQEQAINTMSNGELVVKLYDELIKNLKYATVLFKNDDPVNAQKCTKKCQDIFNYLTVILNDKYELSGNLKKLYTFMVNEVIIASATGDTSHIDGILPQVQELRDAWAEAEKKVRAQNSMDLREK